MSRILMFSIFICFFACNKKAEKNIIGSYKIDKYNILNKKDEIKDYEYLKINANGYFELFYSITDSKSQIKGTWKVKEYYADKVYVSFKYGNSQKTGILKGNIFYFIYPDDFHNGKYKSVIYVNFKKSD